MYRQIVKINDKNDMDSNLEINVEEFIDNNKKIGEKLKKEDRGYIDFYKSISVTRVYI